MSNLNKQTFDEIVKVLVPHMDTSARRRAFITQSLYDAPILLQNMDYEGDAQQFTVNLVRACDQFGQIAPGQLAVVALLTHLREQVGDDGQQAIDRIIAEITRKHIETPFEFVGAAGDGAHIFLSYSRANLPFVQKLTRDLQARGINIWIDKVGLKAGTPDWDNALRDAIKQSDGVVLVASPDSRQSPYVRDELAIAKAARRTLYPVWAAGDEYSDCIPMGMGSIQFVDLRGDAYERGLDELVAVLAGVKTLDTADSSSGESATPTTAEPPPVPRNPYKGLRAFRAEDRGDFFGRDALIAELIEALRFEKGQPRFLAVVGASGSGKSSVVMAGLLPALQDGAIDGSANWRYLDPMVPGTHPLENLTVALADIFPEKSQTAIREDLDNPNTRGLHMLAKQAAKNTRLVLYVDQFEELFTLTVGEDERRHFIDLLTTAVTEPDGTLLVILSLRADFYDRPLEYNTLGNLVKAQTVPVLPMTLADLYDVIEKPARLDDVRVTFEDGLVTDILFAVRDEIGALPLLQFTLDQLFERRDGQTLTRAAYAAMGGVRGALTRHAEQTYLDLPSDEHRRMARALFLRLIEPGQTEQDTTRRRASQSELTLTDAEQTRILQEATAIFTDARLLVSSSDSPRPAERSGEGPGVRASVEVAHEALIREWDRLKLWLNEARDDLRLQKKVIADATDWVRTDRPDNYGGFYAGTLLIDAQTWASHATPAKNEADFIAASVSADEIRREREEATARRVRNFRRASLVLAFMVVLALGAGLFAVLAAVNASKQNDSAATQIAIAGTSEAVSIYLRETAEFEATVFGIQQIRASTQVAALGSIPQLVATLSPQEIIAEATLAATRQNWMPIIQSFEGIEMVLVPAGCFWMGDNFDSDTRPIHKICFDHDFWIDRFEVTNNQFSTFGGVAELQSQWSNPDYPRTNVSWREAQNYCVARGARLPTEPEWEYAARGPNSLRNPWGNELHLDRIAFGGNEPEPVGQHPAGVSWVGAFDMSGNVWERVSSLYLGFPYNPETHEGDEVAGIPRVLKGGAFNAVYPIANRDPDYPYLPTGFRCARSIE